MLKFVNSDSFTTFFSLFYFILLAVLSTHSFSLLMGLTYPYSTRFSELDSSKTKIELGLERSSINLQINFLLSFIMLKIFTSSLESHPCYHRFGRNHRNLFPTKFSLGQCRHHFQAKKAIIKGKRNAKLLCSECLLRSN